jgi:methyl-accepting chemotaxis protein
MEDTMNWSLYSSLSGLLILVFSTLYQVWVSNDIEKRKRDTGDDLDDADYNADLAEDKSNKLAKASLITFSALIFTYILSLTGVAMDDTKESIDTVKARVTYIEEYLFGGPPGPGGPTIFQLQKKLQEVDKKLDKAIKVIGKLSRSTTKMELENAAESMKELQKSIKEVSDNLPKEHIQKSVQNKTWEG